MEEKFITLKEASMLMPWWTIGTIRQYASKRKIPCVLMGSKVFFRESELKKFIAENVIKERGGSYGKSKPTE